MAKIPGPQFKAPCTASAKIRASNALCTLRKKSLDSTKYVTSKEINVASCRGGVARATCPASVHVNTTSSWNSVGVGSVDGWIVGMLVNVGRSVGAGVMVGAGEILGCAVIVGCDVGCGVRDVGLGVKDGKGVVAGCAVTVGASVGAGDTVGCAVKVGSAVAGVVPPSCESSGVGDFVGESPPPS